MSPLKALSVKIVRYLNVLMLVTAAAFASPAAEPGIPPKDSAAIRVMSFNVRCTGVRGHSRGERVDSVIQTIEAVSPDLLGVQEATPEWMADLAARLPAYGFVGVGRDDGVNKGEYSAIFYLKERFEPADSGTFWLSDTPDVPSRSWNSFLHRICTWAVFNDRVSGGTFLHMNTHFDNAFTPRKNSVPLILELAARYDDMPVICTGDFNTPEVSPLYPVLLGGTLNNAKFLAADTMSVITTTGGYPLKRLGCFAVDHILVNSRVEPLVYRVVTGTFDGMLPSDHYPLYCDVMLHAE